MDPDGNGVKECLSLDEVKKVPEWQHEGSRDEKYVDCLKVSVIPEGGEWDPNGENYCFHDLGSEEIKWQIANTVLWMGLEWGVTAAATVVTGGTAGAGTKIGMGFIAGVGSEYVSQYFTGTFKQKWPGHPK